ncbi:MAG: acetyltransferase [Phycisphaerales bacterium]|nr:acetyltransferase [Phycisphaerales bacterium]
MSTDTLLILGAGGNGHVIADLADRSGQWSRIAFLDDAAAKSDADYQWEIIGKCGDLSDHVSGFTHGIVAFGDNELRSHWLSHLQESQLVMAVIVAESAEVSSRASLGPGTVVMPQAAVNIGVRTGPGCIINTGASVDHDCLLGESVHIAPGAHVGGDVAIGDRTWIGIGSSVRHGITIGNDVMVGAGAAVISDLPDECTAVGVPARART